MFIKYERPCDAAAAICGGHNSRNAPLINLKGDLLKFSSSEPRFGSIKGLIIHKFTVFSEALLHGGGLSVDLAVKWHRINCI